MIFLLDTNVVSELRKAKPHGAVFSWYSSYPQTAYAIPSVVLFEIQAGAEMTRRQNASKAAEIDAWIDDIASAAQIIPLDALAARQAARLLHRRPPDLIEDGMIAAIALVQNLIVATRNTRDFHQFGVRQVNPFLFRKP